VAAAERAVDIAAHNSSDDLVRAWERDQQPRRPVHRHEQGEQPWDQAKGQRRDLHPSRQRAGVWEQAARQSRATRPATPVSSVQLALDLGDTPVDGEVSGLPEMSAAERVRAELEILGLDVSRHVVDFYAGFLDQLGVTRSRDLLRRRSRSELLVAGVKVATQTPPVRSGRRVIFLTLDDATGPVDATFFEDAQGPYAATVFHSWLLLVRGELRRTGRHGVSLRATGCWELPALYQVWQQEGLAAVRDLMAEVPLGFADPEGMAGEPAVSGAAESRSTRPVMAAPPGGTTGGTTGGATGGRTGMTAGGMGRRRVLVHSSGFKLSPYADIKPAGEDTKSAPRKLWHSSPGSSGG
jgi:error-prone DNA polymerase